MLPAAGELGLEEETRASIEVRRCATMSVAFRSAKGLSFAERRTTLGFFLANISARCAHLGIAGRSRLLQNQMLMRRVAVGGGSVPRSLGCGYAALGELRRWPRIIVAFRGAKDDSYGKAFASRSLLLPRSLARDTPWFRGSLFDPCRVAVNTRLGVIERDKANPAGRRAGPQSEVVTGSVFEQGVGDQ